MHLLCTTVRRLISICLLISIYLLISVLLHKLQYICWSQYACWSQFFCTGFNTTADPSSSAQASIPLLVSMRQLISIRLPVLQPPQSEILELSLHTDYFCWLESVTWLWHNTHADPNSKPAEFLRHWKRLNLSGSLKHITLCLIQPLTNLAVPFNIHSLDRSANQAVTSSLMMALSLGPGQIMIYKGWWGGGSQQNNLMRPRPKAKHHS